MRFKFFSWVFLCVTLLSGLSMQSAQASPQEDQKTYNVSISLKDATVKGVADALTKQTGILFSYDADLNSMSLGEVKLSRKNSSLTSILDEVFANKGVKYSVVGVTVVLSRTKSSGKRTITGQVNAGSRCCSHGRRAVRRYGDRRFRQVFHACFRRRSYIGSSMSWLCR